MSRIFIVVAIAALAVIAITIWVNTGALRVPEPVGATEVPRAYDTTGGQEMRPRWDSSGGQGDDADN